MIKQFEKAHRRGDTAFTLLEVMIACGIFFMASFGILALVAGTLRNARGLQRGDVDAGMAAAQLYPTLRTNRDEFGSASGDFGETYPDCSWEAQWEPYQTNGLLAVDIIVNRRGNLKPIDHMNIWVFSPNIRTALGGPRRP